MTIKHGILTLAISLTLAGCATDNMAWNDNKAADTAGLPDNPQVGANDKIRALGSLADADYKFIRAVEAGNAFEIDAGQKAQFKSNDAQVKSLAQRIVDDHAKADRQLQALASRKGMPTPAGMTVEQIEKLARLDKLSGTDFDREYLSQQQTVHQDTITLFESASVNAKDTDLREWTAATLPTLRNHLTMVQDQARGMTPPIPGLSH